jgi:xanthine/uracil permease
VKKPLNIVYGVDDTPPLGVTLFSGLQHVVLIAIRLLFPLLVAREAGLAPERVLDVLGMSMIIMGIACVLQAITRGPVGSGYLCPPSFTSAYIAPSLLAATTGGMSLVIGMTLFGGIVESALSRLLRPLRPFFPPEIAGFVVVMVGVTLGSLGTRYVLGVGAPAGVSRLDLAVTVVSLGTMIALNVWTKGSLRVFCALIGMVVGYLAAAVTGGLTLADLKPVEAAPLIHFPRLGHTGWSFHISLAIPFGVAALAACLRAMGDVTTCQKINDAEWTRPSMRSISGGALANGLSTATAAVLGTIGVNTLTSSVGLSSATGVTSRRIAYVIGGMFLVVAFLPKAAALFAIMPRSVLGACCGSRRASSSSTGSDHHIPDARCPPDVRDRPVLHHRARRRSLSVAVRWLPSPSALRHETARPRHRVGARPQRALPDRRPAHPEHPRRSGHARSSDDRGLHGSAGAAWARAGTSSTARASTCRSQSRPSWAAASHGDRCKSTRASTSSRRSPGIYVGAP